jgi:N-acetylmuramoyl-L-alanine amidase
LNASVPVCLVIIDPGHDRTHDPGSRGVYNNNVYYEKDITLAYAGTLKVQLRGILTAGNPGHHKEPRCTRVPVAWKTELTRTGDVSFPPEDRKAKVKRLVSEWLEAGGTRRSVFLVSLHCDGSQDRKYVVSVSYTVIKTPGVAPFATTWRGAYAMRQLSRKFLLLDTGNVLV